MQNKVPYMVCSSGSRCRLTNLSSSPACLVTPSRPRPPCHAASQAEQFDAPVQHHPTRAASPSCGLQTRAALPTDGHPRSQDLPSPALSSPGQAPNPLTPGPSPHLVVLGLEEALQQVLPLRQRRLVVPQQCQLALAGAGVGGGCRGRVGAGRQMGKQGRARGSGWHTLLRAFEPQSWGCKDRQHVSQIVTRMAPVPCASVGTLERPLVHLQPICHASTIPVHPG